MSYQVLARKWRPQVFEDVVGQEHITEILKNSLETGRLHHGYLFVGIRGIGKTTTARILAKALNCVHGPTPQPCNQCEFCREITEGYSMDVEEIDGASNRGVDEVRVLQENVGYAPSRSRYKIFIIDEVHMLTTPAFNALLKTLEEPPAHVIFIMATTEPWKIPATILSRCQKFIFKNSSPEQLIGLLKKITRHEQIEINEKSLALLAKTAGGSVRDAENLLDQVLGFCGSPIQDDDVRYVLGIPAHLLLNDFLAAILTHQASRIFSLMEQLVSHGYNLRLFCMELMERIRNLIVLKLAAQPDRYLSLFDYPRADLERFEAMTTVSELQQTYWQFVAVEREIRVSPNPRYILEMALAAMTHIQALEPLEELHKQLLEIQAQLEQNDSLPGVVQHLPEEQLPHTPDQEFHAPPSEELLKIWQQVVNLVRQKRPSLASRLKTGVPVSLTPNEFTIGFHQHSTVSRQALEEPKNAMIVADAVKELLGQTVSIVTTIHSGGMSVEAMQKRLEKTAPNPPVQPQEFTPPAPPERRSGKGSGSDNKGNDRWQKRSGKPRNHYKPPVEVTIQDLVRLFEGEIEA